MADHQVVFYPEWTAVLLACFQAGDFNVVPRSRSAISGARRATFEHAAPIKARSAERGSLAERGHSFGSQSKHTTLITRVLLYLMVGQQWPDKGGVNLTQGLSRLVGAGYRRRALAAEPRLRRKFEKKQQQESL